MITPGRFAEFLKLLIEVRHLQRHFRKTQDPITRRRLLDMEPQLDAETDRVTAELEQLRPLVAEDPDRPAWIAEADALAAAGRNGEGGGV